MRVQVEVVKAWTHDIGLDYFSPERLACEMEELFEHFDSTSKAPPKSHQNSL